MSAAETHRAIEAVWRIEAPKLIAALARIVRDVGAAEDLAQDALVAAMQQWPDSGIPRNPGAWLMAAAKHRAIDLLRRNKLLERKHAELGRDLEEEQQRGALEIEDSLDDDVGDDLLRLIFTACHPVLPSDSRVALTLRLLCGLKTEEIARAFLAPEPTVAQRIVRAKRTLAEAQVPYEVPRGAELQDRLASVLEVIYLVFNEGYSATSGDDLMRPTLCEEALRLGRITAELLPGQPEVHGLVALMEIQFSRANARIGRGGEPVLLLEQNRALWDRLLIQRGLAALEKAQRLSVEPGAYTLQAAIAACHARATQADQTDWKEIARLYGELVRVLPSPVVQLNRAVAVSMAWGPAAGLIIADALLQVRSMEAYHHLPAVRGDLLFKLERFDEAREEFLRAAALTRNAREQALLQERAARCVDPQSAVGRGEDAAAKDAADPSSTHAAHPDSQ